GRDAGVEADVEGPGFGGAGGQGSAALVAQVGVDDAAVGGGTGQSDVSERAVRAGRGIGQVYLAVIDRLGRSRPLEDSEGQAGVRHRLGGRVGGCDSKGRVRPPRLERRREGVLNGRRVFLGAALVHDRLGGV